MAHERFHGHIRHLVDYDQLPKGLKGVKLQQAVLALLNAVPDEDALEPVKEYYSEVAQNDASKLELAFSGNADAMKLNRWAQQEQIALAYFADSLTADHVAQFKIYEGRTPQAADDPMMIMWLYRAGLYRLTQMALARFRAIAETLIDGVETLDEAETIFLKFRGAGDAAKQTFASAAATEPDLISEQATREALTQVEAQIEALFVGLS